MIAQATQGDVGVPLRFSVKDNKGAVVNLTGGTATLLMFPTVPINGGGVSTYSATITDPLNGVATYTTTGNEFPVGNIKYQMQIKVVVGGQTLSSDIVEIFVRPTLSAQSFPYLGY